MHAGQIEMVERLRALGDAFFDAVADEIERMAQMVRHASNEGVTFPPGTLPRVAGAETIVECPVCKTSWQFDNHDDCPTCGLTPQGLN